LTARDADYDMIAPTSIPEKYFSTSHKKSVPVNKFAWWWGKDISGNYINFSIDDNTSPHVIYTGRTGAGKSRQAINGLEQIIGFDKDTGEAIRFDDFDVRYVDVGFSACNLAMGLQKKYGDRVKIYPSTVSGLRFSLFNIGKDGYGKADEDDLSFMMHLINFSLEIQSAGTANDGSAKLTGGELDFLSRIVAHMIENDKYSDIFVEELKMEGGYDDLCDEIIKKGYSLKTNVSELPDEYDFLRKPILDDVLTEIEVWTKKSDFSELEKGQLEKLSLKMAGLKNLKFIAFHSNMKKTTENFTHIDFDEIKDDPVAFSIIYWLLVKEWIGIMKTNAKQAFKNKEAVSKRTLFYVDEAHNFFQYETFSVLLVKAVKEFRKYGGVFFFLSQELEDAPQKVISQLGTKVFVVPPEDKSLLKGIIKRYLGEFKKGDDRVLDNITDYMMYIRSDKGAIGMKYLTDPKYDWFYKPNHPDFLKIGEKA